MSILSTFSQASDYDYTPYDYNTTFDSGTTTMSNEAAAGIMMGMLIFYLIATIALYVITSLALSRIFKKAGVEGWKAWVPVYNMWVMLELGGQQGFWAVLMFVPFVNIAAIIIMFIAMYHIGLKLGKPGAFVLVAIFLNLVWYIWLAVDKSTWNESAGAPRIGTPHPAGPVTPQPSAPTSNDNQSTPPTV